MELTITFTILAVTIILFMTNKVRADLVALLAILALVLTGVLTAPEALSGFSNSVVIMLAALFIVGAGIVRTGLAQLAGDLLIRVAGENEKRLFIALMLIVAFVGAFMSNTGTVAIMLPIVVAIAMKINENPSKYLLPLSYIASFSGLLTLIASPANLIVSETLVKNGYPKLGFFQMTPIGLIGVIVGVIYLFFIRHRLGKSNQRNDASKNSYQLSPFKIMQEYELNNRLIRVDVPKESRIIGKPLSQLKIPHEFQLCILKIKRSSAEGIHFLPITFQKMADASTVFQERDELYIQGQIENVHRFAKKYHLTVQEVDEEAEELISKQMGIAEVLLTPKSTLLNKTIREIGFREKYDVNILGINRQGKLVLKEMTKVKLKFGDALLVQGDWSSIERLAGETKDVVVIGRPEQHAGVAAATGKAPLAALNLLLMVALMVFDIVPAVVAVSIGAILMILTGCIRNMDDAYREINWETVVLIGAMLPMAIALEKTGGMELLSEGIIDSLGSFGTLGVLAGIYVLTMLFGQFISNTATAVLFAPIAMNAALMMDSNPTSFLIAVAVGANMSFATPVASPTNALVMTAGGYRFTDFVKAGVPLQIIMFIVMMIALPLLFPF